MLLIVFSHPLVQGVFYMFNLCCMREEFCVNLVVMHKTFGKFVRSKFGRY